MRTTRAIPVRLSALLLLGVTAAAASEDDREFIFTDDEGHVVLRFVAAGSGELGPAERNEVLNQEFSVMVHDRMHADIRFESEPLDSAWAGGMEPRLRQLFGHAATAYSHLDVECRSSTCRVQFEQSTRLSVTEHQRRLQQLQSVVEDYIGADPASFAPAFFMAGYEQASQTPMIKIFLQRATDD